jgi:hypothetical protein
MRPRTKEQERGAAGARREPVVAQDAEDLGAEPQAAAVRELPEPLELPPRVQVELADERVVFRP